MKGRGRRWLPEEATAEKLRPGGGGVGGQGDGQLDQGVSEKWFS